MDGLIVNLAPITGRVVRAMRRCKCISRYGVGYDNIDVQAVRESGIHLANVPDLCSEDVSDQAMALFLDCVRKVSRKDRCVRAGQWNLTGLQRVHRIAGKTFGFALKSGQIACAGLDVFSIEPLPADSELRRLDSVTLTDHAGWYSEEAMAELKTKAALNIVDTLTNGTPRYPVLTL